MLTTRRSHSVRGHRRGAALYTIVVSVSLLVSVLGLAALNVVRVERRTATSSAEVVAARMAAHAAAEMALRDIQRDDYWRLRYSNNVETTSVPLGDATASWKLIDTGDGDLSDSVWDSVEVQGIGRNGSAVWVESVTLEAVSVEVGPVELRSYTAQSSIGSRTVDDGEYWAQYFEPNLPSRAQSWKVTQVQLYCEKASTSSSASVNVCLQGATASWRPDNAVVYEQVVVPATSWPSEYRWHAVDFSTNAGLDPDSGICLALVTSQDQVMRFQYRNGNANQNDSAMIRGVPGTWHSPDDDDCFLYRVYGSYIVAEMKVVPGTWKRTSL